MWSKVWSSIIWYKGSLGGMVDNYGQLMNYLFYLFSKVCRSMIWYKGSLAGMVDHYSQLINYLFYLFSKVRRSCASQAILTRLTTFNFF